MRAQMFGTWQGFVESGTEFLPAHKLFGDLAERAALKTVIAHQFKSELVGEEIATALQDLGEWVTLPEKKDRTFWDYLRERPSAAAATAIAVLVTVGTTSVVAHGTARLLEQLGEIAPASKTLTRAPEKFSEIIDRAVAGTPLATVYLPVDTFTTYWQSQDKDPAAIATRLTGDATAYERARQTGQEIAVPLGAYVTQIAPTEHNTFFAQEARTVTGKMNAREDAEFVNRIAAAVASDAKAASETPAEPTPAQKVRAAVVEQLVAAGTPKGTANVMAAVYEAVYGTLATRAGVDPFTLYQARPLRVSRPELLAPLADRQQLTREGTPLAGQLADRQQLTREGTPLAGQEEGVTLATDAPQAATPWRAAAFLLHRIASATRRRAGLSDVDSQRVQAQPGGRADVGGPDAGAAARGPIAVPEAYADHYQQLLVGARANGFTGTDDDFARLYNAQLDAARMIARDLHDYEGAEAGGGTDLLAAIAKAGGLGIKVEAQSTEYSKQTGRLVSSGGMVGELEDLLEGLNRHAGIVRRGARAGQTLSRQMRRSGGLPGMPGIIVRSGGLSLDYMREAMNEDPRWAGKFENAAELLGAVSDAILVELGVKKAPGATSYDLGGLLEGLLNVRPDTTWWQAPEAVDESVVDELEGGLDGDGDTSFDVSEFDQTDARLARADDAPYQQDLFGAPIEGSLHPADGSAAAGRAGPAGGDLDPARSLQRDEVEGRFATRTQLVTHVTRTLGRTQITTAADAAAALAYLGRGAQERFDGVVVDRDGKPLAVVGSFKGRIAQVPAYPDVVVAEVFRVRDAAAVWFAHNHPSGSAELSQEDLNINARFAAIFRGTQIVMRGLIAIGGSATGEAEFSHANTLNKVSPIVPVPAASAQVDVPAIEREFATTGTLGDKVATWNDAMRVVLAIANNHFGVVFFDTKLRPTGFLPVSESDAAALREGGRLDWLYRAVSILAPASAVIYAPGGPDGSPAAWNLANALHATSVRVMDILGEDHNGEMQSAARGRGDLNHVLSGRFNQDRHGFIQIGDTEFHIGLLPTANLSTFLHETGHLFLELFGNVVDQVRTVDEGQRTPAQQGLLNDYGALLKSLGVESRAQIGVEQHEQFARLYEAYLREGQAPSAELRGPFARFRAWLLSIYQTLRRLNVKLTPEVTSILDRLHATDVALGQAAQDAQAQPLFQTPAGMGVSPAEFALYTDTVEQAGNAAREELEQRLLAEVRREQESRWKAAQAVTRAAVTPEVHAQPVFRALAAMQTGTSPDGETLPDGAPIADGTIPTPLKLSLPPGVGLLLASLAAVQRHA